MFFKASLDNTAKVITIAVSVIFAFAIAAQFTQIESKFQWVVGTSLIFIYIICFLWSIRAYTLDKNELIIKRPVNSLHFNLTDIESFQLLDQSALGLLIRTFASGGLFGYFGKFYSANLGNLTMYATRRDRGILIKMKSGKSIVISPDNPDTFMQQFKADQN